jgi:hypothetical protein
MATIAKFGDPGGCRSASQIGFREGSQLSANERLLTQKYQGCDQQFEVIVQSRNVSVCVDIAHLESKLKT